MNFKVIVFIVGVLIIAVGLSMLAPLGVSYFYGEGDTQPLLYSFLITVFAGLILTILFKSPGEMGNREAYAVVTLGWLAAAAFGSLPFLLNGTFDTITDAFFESMSGFTTTGATVITDIEAQPHGILLWRSTFSGWGAWGSSFSRWRYYRPWAWGVCRCSRPRCPVPPRKGSARV